MDTVSMETLLKLRDFHAKSLTKINRQIMELERKSDENLSTKAVADSSGRMPLHSAVEHPNKGKPAAKRRTGNRRGSE